jgi:hypothetical protein
MATTTPKKGNKFTPSSRPKYFNSPQRAQSVKNTVEMIKTYALISKGRPATQKEKNAAIYLSLPLAREEKK